MSEFGAIIIERIISEGVKLLLSEIMNYIKTGMQYQAKLHLPSSAILSENILLHDKMPDEVKKFVANYKNNLKFIIAGIADKIEEEQYKKLDNDIKNMDLLSHERNKVTIIYDCQKTISLSFQTLNTVIDLFTRANDKVKQEIDNPNKTTNQAINLRLQNAILVYELLNFVTSFVKNFSLKGKAEIGKIKNQLLLDIQSIESKIQQELIDKYSNVSDEVRISTMKDVEAYKEILNNMRKRWDIFDQKIEDLEQKVEEYKTILPDLEMYKATTEIQIEILTLTAIMNIVENNLNLVKRLHRLKRDMLVSFTPKDYYELIGRQAT